MRVVLVCGDRNWNDYKKIKITLQKEHQERPITYLVEGGARGADTLAKVAAKKLGSQVGECEALWEFHGTKAGPIRNQMQLNLALKLVQVGPTVKRAYDPVSDDEFSVLAFHSDLKSSKGTMDMVRKARSQVANVKVRVIK